MEVTTEGLGLGPHIQGHINTITTVECHTNMEGHIGGITHITADTSEGTTKKQEKAYHPVIDDALNSVVSTVYTRKTV